MPCSYLQWLNAQCCVHVSPFATGGESDHAALKYPSSSRCTHNWDKMVTEIKKEEAEEKPEGDAGLNKFFQQLYSGADDHVQRAMNKSFVRFQHGTLSHTVCMGLPGQEVVGMYLKACPRYTPNAHSIHIGCIHTVTGSNQCTWTQSTSQGRLNWIESSLADYSVGDTAVMWGVCYRVSKWQDL